MIQQDGNVGVKPTRSEEEFGVWAGACMNGLRRVNIEKLKKAFDVIPRVFAGCINIGI